MFSTSPFYCGLTIRDRVLGPKAYETCIIQVFRKHFYLLIHWLILCVINFQSWKVKEGQYLQPRPNSGQGGFKNLKKIWASRCTSEV